MKSIRKPLNMAAVAAIDELYAKLPSIQCKKLCQAFCGPIAMTRTEHQRIVNRLGRVPVADGLECPLLKRNGDCRVHDIRPGLCRIFGLVDDPLMICPHGCVPSRWMTNEETREFLTVVEELGRI